MLERQLDTSTLDVTKIEPNTKLLQETLGYSKAQLLQKGPLTLKSEEPSSNKRSISNSEEKDLTLIVQQKDDNVFSVLLPHSIDDLSLRYNNAHYLLFKIPETTKNLPKTLKNESPKESDSRNSQIQNIEDVHKLSVTEKMVDERINITPASKSLKNNQGSWPSSGYASASSWAGSYGRPSAGGASANAQASASANHHAGESSATSTSGSSTGTGYYGGSIGGGSGSNAATQTTSGVASGSTGGSSSSPYSGAQYNNYYYRPAGSGGGGNAGSTLDQSSLSGLGTNSQGSGVSAGSSSQSGGHLNPYFRPPSSTGVSVGTSSGLESSGNSAPHNTGYHTQNIGSINGAGSSAGSSSYSYGAGINNYGSNSRPGGYYGGYKPSNFGSGDISGVNVGGTSTPSGYQGNYHKPTGPSVGSSSAGVSNYHGNYNKPSSGSFSGSTSSSGSGAYYNGYNRPTPTCTGSYNPYNRPTTASSGNYNNYHKPSSSSPSTTASVGYGGYYSSSNKPTSSVSSENHQNFINKPPTTGASGVYYNGQFITSPNSGSNIEGISINRPSNTGINTSGTGVSTSSFTAGSSGSGLISSGISTSFGGPGSTYTTVFHVPWWLEAGVFSHGAIIGSMQGYNSSSSNSNNFQGINNFGTESSMVFGVGGATSISSGTGSQGGEPSSGIINGAGSISGPLAGSNIQSVGLPLGTLAGTGTESISGGVNNNVGSIPIAGTETPINTTPLVGSVSTAGSSQGSASSTTLGSIPIAITNPGIQPEVTSSVGAINSGTTVILPWWFLTGVFSGSVEHPISSQGGASNSVDGLVGITESTSIGPSNGAVAIPEWTGNTTSLITEPGNNLGSLPSEGGIGSQPTQSVQSVTGIPGEFGSNVNTGSSVPMGTSSGNPNVENLTDGPHSGSENIHGSSGLIIGPSVPGELPTTSDTGTLQVEGISSQPTSPLASSIGHHPVGELSPQQGISPEVLPGNSGLTTATVTQDNTFIGSTIGQSPIADVTQQGNPPLDNIPGSSQSAIPVEPNLPSHTGPGVPSVGDIAVSIRPPGWSGGNNGPATLIGSRPRPISVSSASSSSFGSSINNVQFPYKVSEEENSDIGTISVQQTPWWLASNGKPSDPPQRFQTAVNEKIISEPHIDTPTENSKTSENGILIINNVEGKVSTNKNEKRHLKKQVLNIE